MKYKTGVSPKDYNNFINYYRDYYESKNTTYPGNPLDTLLDLCDELTYGEYPTDYVNFCDWVYDSTEKQFTFQLNPEILNRNLDDIESDEICLGWILDRRGVACILLRGYIRLLHKWPPSHELTITQVKIHDDIHWSGTAGMEAEREFKQKIEDIASLDPGSDTGFGSWDT